MHLLSRGYQDELVLTYFGENDIPPYAILSHTWGDDSDEVSFKDVRKKRSLGKAGYTKINFCLDRAAADGLQYCWIDTCCIDKTSSQELTEAINSMFKWYEGSKKCYVYLVDVPKTGFENARYWTRGWTLQELLAPRDVEFFSSEDVFLGSKKSLIQVIHDRTQIPLAALKGHPLAQFGIEEKLSWMTERQTKREVDMVYSLLGIFGVSMSLNYGEDREDAQARLEDAIRRKRVRDKRKQQLGRSSSWFLKDLDRQMSFCDLECSPREKDFEAQGQMQEKPWATPESDRNAIEQWLNAEDSIRDYEDCLEGCYPGTSEWIFNDQMFTAWQHENHASKSKMLWIHGSAGQGKSVLCSRIIHRLEATQPASVAYCFSSVLARAGQKPKDIVRSWMLQLGRRNPDVLDMMTNRFEVKRREGETRALQPDVWDLFERLLTRMPGLILVLDGLDEFDRASEERAGFLRALKQRAANTATSFLVVSRNEGDIREETTYLADDEKSGWVLYERRLDTDQLHNDIRIFSQFIVDRKLSKKDADLRLELAQSIANKSEGMFLWVKMQEGHLRSTKSPKQLRDAVSRMPIDLAKTYEKKWVAIQKKDREDRERALMMLRWALYATRDLTVAELVEALAIPNGHGEVEELVADSMPELIDDDYISAEILDCCESLIRIQDTAQSGPAEERRIKLAHFTVQEYLNGVLPELGHFDTSIVAASHQESILSEQCVRYLDCDDTWHPWRRKTKESRKFLEYATIWWSNHFRPGNQSLNNACKRFLVSDNENFLHWRRYFECFYQTTDDDALAKLSSEPSTPLYYMALFGLVDALNLHLEAACPDLNRNHGRHGTPLAAACTSGYVSSFHTLLKAGADINIEGGMWGSALNAALFNGHEEIATTLLGLEPDISIKDYRGRTALYIAAARGFTRMLEALIPRGQINTPEQGGTTPTGIAASNGHLDAVRLLLNKGADPHIANEEGWTPFNHASNCGSSGIVRILLDYGIDPRTTQNNGWNPLNGASLYGHVETARLLLDHGADINGVNKDGWTPLTSACDHGHCEAVCLLLDNRADLELTCGSGWTPLTSACRAGYLDVARILLTRGADKDWMDPSGLTPLTHACGAGHLDVVTLLLSEGAGLEEPDDSGNSPFAHAANNAHVELADFLLDKGANVDTVNKIGHTPFRYSCASNNIKMVQMLLEKGANIDKMDTEEETPLLVSCAKGHMDLVRLLIDGGADISIANKHGVTPFELLCYHGHVETARLLLGKGADMNRADEENETPLSLACHQGHFEVVQLLLDNGATIDIANTRGATSLNHACRGGNIEIVRALFDKGADLAAASLKGSHPLIDACIADNVGIFNLLLERGADYKQVTNNGSTILHRACSNGAVEITRLLLDMGLDTNQADDEGTSPLYAASQSKSLEVVRLLLDQGAEIRSDGKGKSPLHTACYNGFLEITRLLLDRGAEVEAKDSIATNITPLILAARNGHAEVIRLMLERGASAQTLALSVASSNGYTDAVQILISHGADVNSRSFGDGPLLAVVSNEGHLEVAKLLIESGAAVNADPGIYGTALFAASKSGHEQIVQLLLDNGAEINTDSGSNALYAACSSGHSSITQLLLDRGADINAALYAAAHEDNADAVQLLVSKGADVSARDRHGWTLWMIATVYGRQLITKLLLRAGESPGTADQNTELRPKSLVVASNFDWGTIAGDGLTVTAEKAVGSTTSEFFQCRSDHPMLFSSNSFYFEMTVLKGVQGSLIGIGVCEQLSQPRGMPGWNKGSWGYHGDDGRFFHEVSRAEESFGPTYAEGDVVGCGGDRQSGVIYFTKNGKHLGEAVSGIRKRLFAVVGVGHEDISVSINFGSTAFVYQTAGSTPGP